MITLHQFPRGYGLDNPSPFCLKVEICLQAAGLPYRLATASGLARAPKGKFPYIIDGAEPSVPGAGSGANAPATFADPVAVADSEFIIDYLRDCHGVDLEAGLTGYERGVGRGATRLVEHHLYWMLVASRWLDAELWPVTRQVFFGDVPAPVRRLVARTARRNVANTLFQQGVGRHSQQELRALAVADLEALAGLVGESLFVAGDLFSRHDAAVYAMLRNILGMTPASWLTVLARTFPSLSAYCLRIEQHLDQQRDRRDSQSTGGRRSAHRMVAETNDALVPVPVPVPGSPVGESATWPPAGPARSAGKGRDRIVAA